MYGKNKDKISGNARIVSKLPLLAINITAKEEDLLNHSKCHDNLLRFYLAERLIEDKYGNHFVIVNGIFPRQRHEFLGAKIIQRMPQTIISIVIPSSFIKEEDFQFNKSKTGFIRMHIVEDIFQESGDFEIKAGHYNYVPKEEEAQ